MDFHHKHVIVTGGTSGIGRALARLLSEKGAHISIIARRQELLDETVAELGKLAEDPAQRMTAYSADLSDWEQTKRAIATLTADIPPDILINNAGFAQPGHFADIPLDIFHKTMDIDYFGTVYATKAVVPEMLERKSGHIVNVSSMAGFLGTFGYTAYAPAKFAVRGFTESLRQELKPHGIHVSIVFPPDTDTPQLHYENQFKPPETQRISGTIKPQSAKQVARAIVRGIEQRKTYITPGFDPWLYFVLFNGPIGLFHWYCDRLVAKTQKERKTP
jgi:3-dehydrosphinganine reductase